MSKRFTVRQIKVKSYTRQGWVLNEVIKFGVFDREWRNNLEAVHGKFYMYSKVQADSFRCIDTSYSKACAQFWADWLNENRANVFGRHIDIPGPVFKQGIEM